MQKQSRTILREKKVPVPTNGFFVQIRIFGENEINTLVAGFEEIIP